MFFLSSSIRSRLASLLRPWMQEEPEIELELGFFRSFVRARNLVLNPSALDRLLLGGSSRISVKKATIGEICVRISPWRAPALNFEVHGIDFIFAPRFGSFDLFDRRSRIVEFFWRTWISMNMNCPYADSMVPTIWWMSFFPDPVWLAAKTWINRCRAHICLILYAHLTCPNHVQPLFKFHFN